MGGIAKVGFARDCVAVVHRIAVPSAQRFCDRSRDTGALYGATPTFVNDHMPRQENPGDKTREASRRSHADRGAIKHSTTAVLIRPLIVAAIAYLLILTGLDIAASSRSSLFRGRRSTMSSSNPTRHIATANAASHARADSSGEILTIVEVAQILRMHRNTVYRAWRHSGLQDWS